jgi:transcription antitermination factor NusG
MTSYLPLRKKTHTYGRRKREFESPLFPGYVFCIVDIHQRSFLRQNRYVANILDVIEQEKLVGQLNQVHRALAVGDVLEVRPYLVKGTPVMVKNGPFKGMEGVVERVKGQTRVVLNVDMIQQGISFEIDAECLVPA